MIIFINIVPLYHILNTFTSLFHINVVNEPFDLINEKLVNKEGFYKYENVLKNRPSKCLYRMYSQKCITCY